MTHPSSKTRRSRREVLGLMAGAAALVVSARYAPLGVGQAHAQDAASAQRIADHFSSVRTMAGEFVQFAPNGEQTGGKFFLERPGKLRFNYDAPANIRLIADGRSVLIENTRLRTNQVHALHQTPLRLILADRIDLSGNRVRSFREEPDQITMELADRSVFGNATMAMMFDPSTYELKQWTITDAQGKDTTVMIFNVQQNVQLDPAMFTINYARVDSQRSGN